MPPPPTNKSTSMHQHSKSTKQTKNSDSVKLQRSVLSQKGPSSLILPTAERARQFFLGKYFYWHIWEGIYRPLWNIIPGHWWYWLLLSSSGNSDQQSVGSSPSLDTCVFIIALTLGWYVKCKFHVLCNEHTIIQLHLRGFVFLTVAADCVKGFNNLSFKNNN